MYHSTSAPWLFFFTSMIESCGNHSLNFFVTTFAPLAKSLANTLPVVGLSQRRPLYHFGYSPVVRKPTLTAPAVVFPARLLPKNAEVSACELRNSNCGQPLTVYLFPSYVLKDIWASLQFVPLQFLW